VIPGGNKRERARAEHAGGIDLSDVAAELRQPVAAALAAAGVENGHLSIELVDARRIRELNREHRGKDAATDVLAFPIDGSGSTPGPRELGDVAICPEHCSDVTEAAVHGVLHLCGYDHETDDGEMLALQAQIMKSLQTSSTPGRGSERARSPVVMGASERRQRRQRSGFVGLAGRPNVGKSTIVNALVGSRVAIVSMRPQTTRRAIRGIATDAEVGRQLVLVDLPGVQRPRDVLTERMQRRVERELADSDVALLVVNGEEGIGPGDRFIARALLQAKAGMPTVCAVNKIDRVGPNELVPVLAEAAELEGVDEVFPVSARSGEGLDTLVERLGELVPEGEFLYPPEDRSDQSSEVMLAELIREQVLNRTRQEIPHSVEVQVREVAERDDGLLSVRADIWAEADSQKRILIGRGGSKIGEIGTAARRSLEAELNARVHLDLQVQVRRRWRRDESLLDRLGIE
jgi:GTP-binding protein Era